MGSGLCRRSRERPQPARVRSAEGLYRKMVFNYAKQWTRSDRHHQKNGRTNNTNQTKRSKKKPIISGPFPADPDKLEGEKWRYVILTRLDTEPPPERPPRTKRHRPQRTEIATVGRGWGSLRRRSRGVRDSFQRRSGRRATAVDVRGQQRLSAAELAELVLQVYRRGPAGRPVALPAPPAGADHRCGAECACRTPVKPAVASRYTPPRQSGFFQSVGRAKAMADNLLL